MLMRNYIVKYVKDSSEFVDLCGKLVVKNLSHDSWKIKEYNSYQKIYNSSEFEAIVKRVKLAKAQTV